MSKKFLISVLLTFFILNTTALALTDKVFTDQGVFASWYSKEVKDLTSKNIITGYKDGSFKPDQNITRAESAVIIDRAYDDLMEQMSEIMMAYDELEDVKFDIQVDSNSTPKVALAIAMAKLRELDNFKPSDLEADGLVLEYDFRKLSGKNIPQGYEVYQKSSLPTYEYYVHWLADEYVPESGGEKTHIDQWYGPFEPSVWYMN